MELLLKHKLKIYVLALICSFGLGCLVGYIRVEYIAKTYIGTLIKIEQSPSEVKNEKKDEVIDRKVMQSKKPEAYPEQYSFLLRDIFGSQTTVFVTKEEYKQFEVGDKYRRQIKYVCVMFVQDGD